MLGGGADNFVQTPYMLTQTPHMHGYNKLPRGIHLLSRHVQASGHKQVRAYIFVFLEEASVVRLVGNVVYRASGVARLLATLRVLARAG